MIEYPALIYKINRDRSYVASCIAKNLIGFGKTEEDALNNLMESIQTAGEGEEISLKPIYGFLKAL